jgi:superfamily II DNA or RNA helicase
MESSTKQLREYQVGLITDVCRASEDVLVEQPTGSGKTMQIVTLVAMHLGQRFSHAIISAPQEQIEQGFVKRDYQTIAFPVCHGVAVPSLAVPEKLIRGARISTLGSVKQVAAYLRQPGPVDYALACTHAALNQLTADKLPDDLTGKALFIDEAHHASADGLSQIVTLWRERGGRLFFFTATPYRGDGRAVRLDSMRAFRRSLAEHMAEGFAPRHLESEIVALGQPGDGTTAGEFSGEETPRNIKEVIAAICRRWLADGKPKTIVRVPPMQGGRSAELVSRLMGAFSSQGARVLDATGTTATDKRRFLEALEAEKSRTYAASGFDVMVGIQRVLEGTDWPVCSAVYCVGMPGSLNTVVQFLGRAMRLKGEDYPAAQRDRARLVFFVPCGGGAALSELSIDHSRHALLTCCFLADHEVGQEWIVLREVRRGIEAALGSRTENPAAADAENEADEPLDPAVRAEVELVMAAAREQIVSNGGEATVGEVVQVAAITRPDLPEEALQRVAVEILAVQADVLTADAVQDAIQQEIAKRVRIDPLVKKAMAEAFTVVLEEFRDVTLNESAVLESVGRQVHGVTGGQMGEFAQRLRDAVPKPLTEEQILLWADAHYERTGEWPTTISGQVFGENSETWTNINSVLWRGGRALPGGSSLAQLLAEYRGRRNKKGLPPFEIEQILRWADTYHSLTGKWPTVRSGAIPQAPGETWSSVNTALVNGIRGLPANSSLPKLLTEHRGKRNHLSLPDLSLETILAWADKHHELMGTWPDRKAGPVLGESSETWANLNAALHSGGRGLPGGSSLAKVFAEYRSVRNRKALPPLSTDKILGWADTYHQRTDDWPTKNTGPVDESPSDTWGKIDTALRTGIRGIGHTGSSLARLLADQRGVRNKQGLPHLSIEQILTWVDAYHECTGNWPTQESGTIDGEGALTWKAVHLALHNGGRGLPAGLSLAKLLAEHRSVRNRLAPPPLELNQILGWVDAFKHRTGRWPKQSSGPLDEVPGETWKSIDFALVKGKRGLPGGSSLARLVEQHRRDVPS